MRLDIGCCYQVWHVCVGILRAYPFRDGVSFLLTQVAVQVWGSCRFRAGQIGKQLIRKPPTSAQPQRQARGNSCFHTHRLPTSGLRSVLTHLPGCPRGLLLRGFLRLCNLEAFILDQPIRWETLQLAWHSPAHIGISLSR